MGRSIQFPSLGKSDELGYVLHSSAFEYGFRDDPLRLIAPWAGSYLTYGDGMVQHSPAICCSVELMGDYLASLTTFCLDPRNEDALEIASNHWRSLDIYNERVKPSNIRKAHQIRHKEGKTRYVMGRHLTVSSADSKRHDKRWYEIVEWMNGSVDATFGLLCMGGGTIFGLERYLILSRIAEVLYEDDGCGRGRPEDHFDRFKGQHLHDAFRAFEALMLADQQRRMMKAMLDTYSSNVAKAANAQTA
jgi:hypothetical protein